MCQLHLALSSGADVGSAVEGWKRRALLAVRFLITLVVIAAVAYLLYRLARVAASSVPASLIGIFATALVAHVFQRLLEIHAAQRQRKADAYHDFTNLLFVSIVAPIAEARAKGQRFKPSRDTEAKIAALSAKVVLAANPKVLKRYCDFLDETMTADSTVPSRKIFDDLADLIRMFRREMGYGDGNLSNADLYPLFQAPRAHILSLPETRPKKGERDDGAEAAVSPVPTTPVPKDAPTDASDAT